VPCACRGWPESIDDGSPSPSVGSAPGKTPHLPKSCLISADHGSSRPTLPQLRRGWPIVCRPRPASMEAASAPEKSAYLCRRQPISPDDASYPETTPHLRGPRPTSAEVAPSPGKWLNFSRRRAAVNFAETVSGERLHVQPPARSISLLASCPGVFSDRLRRRRTPPSLNKPLTHHRQQSEGFVPRQSAYASNSIALTLIREKRKLKQVPEIREMGTHTFFLFLRSS
jgi:hypothetical protein